MAKMTLSSSEPVNFRVNLKITGNPPPRIHSPPPQKKNDTYSVSIVGEIGPWERPYR